MRFSRNHFWKFLILLGVVLLNVFVYAYFYFHNEVIRNGGLFSVWAIENNNEVNPRWFVFDASKNQYTGKVIVKNFSMKMLNLDLYFADYHQTKDGSFGLETNNDEKNTIGKWTKSEQNSLRLFPTQEKEVTFTLQIPEGTDLSESYAGGFAVEWKGSQSGLVQLNTRMVVPIFLQFPNTENTILQSSLEHVGIAPKRSEGSLQATDFSPQFAIQALEPQEFLYETWFDFHGDKKEYEGKILLKNLNEKESVSIHLTTAEYDKNSDGFYVLRDDGSLNANLGQWIQFAQTDYELKGGEIKEVPFRITIPSDVDRVASYAASIVAEQTIPSLDPSIPSLKVRLGVRTFYRYLKKENVILNEMKNAMEE